MLLPSEEIAEMLGSRGIAPQDRVVIYSNRLRDATLAALALLRAGHRRLAILEGGWPVWLAEGREVSTETTPRPPVEYPPSAGADDFTVSTDEVLAASRESGDRATLIVDVRSREEYVGEENAVDGRAGHVPGAVRYEFNRDEAPGPDGTFWQPASALAKAWEELGAGPERPVIVYCQSGHRASLTYFTLRYILGRDRVRWYDGSWKAWGGTASLPVETAG
jgi:thiosulfate/3-mercaptopyruvate sulfurtransferase